MSTKVSHELFRQTYISQSDHSDQPTALSDVGSVKSKQRKERMDLKSIKCKMRHDIKECSKLHCLYDPNR